jgi:hypothetical protein
MYVTVTVEPHLSPQQRSGAPSVAVRLMASPLGRQGLGRRWKWLSLTLLAVRLDAWLLANSTGHSRAGGLAFPRNMRKRAQGPYFYSLSRAAENRTASWRTCRPRTRVRSAGGPQVERGVWAFWTGHQRLQRGPTASGCGCGTKPAMAEGGSRRI